MRYFSRSDEAEDTLQNGFITVFNKIETFTGSGSLEGWVRKIMVNTALSSIRKNKKLMMNIEMDSVEYALPSSDLANAKLKTKELLKIIQSLPSGGRTIFNLYAIEGYSHAEIAAMLGISEGASKSQYSRARAYLRLRVSND
jgi:RNA polymerase sigma-70 factor (ECF subfamily)